MKSGEHKRTHDLPLVLAYIEKLNMPNLHARVEAHGCMEIDDGNTIRYDKRALLYLTKVIPIVQCEEYEKVKEVAKTYGVRYRE